MGEIAVLIQDVSLPTEQSSWMQTGVVIVLEHQC